MNRTLPYLVIALLAFTAPQRLAAQDKEPDAVRLQKFWNGYYGAVRDFYSQMDKLDWVAYYKAHGERLPANPKGDNKRVAYVPVFVEPVFKVAAPNWRDPKDTLGLQPRGEGERPWEFKAVAFGTDAAEATKVLNQLGGEGWQYVGPLSNGLVAFRRPARQAEKGLP